MRGNGIYCLKHTHWRPIPLILYHKTKHTFGFKKIAFLLQINLNNTRYYIES